MRDEPVTEIEAVVIGVGDAPANAYCFWRWQKQILAHHAPNRWIHEEKNLSFLFCTQWNKTIVDFNLEAEDCVWGGVYC